MMQNKRIESLDVLRGVALMFVILFHSSIYNYANINRIDFSNPPLLIVLMSFMALWGGIFIIYSAVVNAVMVLRRNQKENNSKIFFHLTIAGVLYLFFHYILNIFLGRWNVDFINNKPDMTVIASTLRNMHLTLPNATKFFEGSSLSIIALNLIILSWVLFLLLKNNGENKATRNYLWLGIPGFLIIILSFVRVPLYGLFTQAIESNNYFLATWYNFTFANPYPLLPYLAYGFFGALIGLMIFNNRKDLFKKVIVPLGILFVLFGLAGMMNFQKTISKPDYFWYFKTNFELGLFLLLLVFTILIFEPRTKFLNKLPIFKWFTRISLTIYMLETFVSEIIRIILHSFLPNWDQTINGCLAFGAFNIVIWIIILFFWRKVNFKYSLEYFWVRFFNRIGKQSTKMDF
jgi:peptidoglycan/LPS O-acetylase OafA/YrhL